MGKVISDEDIKLNIIVNGNEAQKELFDLEKSTRKLTEENKALLLQKRELKKQGAENTKAYRDLTKTINENSKEIAGNKTKMAELQKQIGITGLTIKQLGDQATILKMKLRNAIPGSEAYQRYNTQLTAINARMAELRGNANQTRLSISSLADGFNKYAALGASVLAVLTGVVLSLQKMIDWNGKLADAQSNVQKTTGMTKDEVDDLTKSFGLLQTRTARIDLLGIAEVGGRIGIAKAEIKDFVNVMNKASVALGDSFEGGAEEVADKLGKIKGLYDELKNAGVEVAFNAVGSAINDLGADGSATEENLAAFTTRVGALPDALKPSIAEALGLGAAFEESGLKAELAGNNYGKVISIAARDFPAFAKVMGVSQQKVKDLLNTNPTEFFLQFSESLKGLDATQLAKVLDYLKLNDNEVKMVLGAASKNTDLFREKIDLANKSLNEGTSLVNEYDIKNNNLAATLERIQKKVVGAFSSETIVNSLSAMAEWIAKVVGASEDLDGSGQKWRNTLAFIAKALAVVTAAMLTNVAWQKLVVLWTTRNTQGNLLYTLGVKARAFAEGVSIVASQAYAATMMLVSGKIRGATQAIRVMTATMMTTPWGLIISLIAAVGVAYIAFSDSVDKATLVQKTLSDVHLEATKSIAAQQKEVETLTKIVKDENIAEGTRIKALERLNELIPDHIGVLTLENIKMLEGTDILKKYTDEIYKNARAKAAQAKFDELARQKLEVEAKSGSEYQSGLGKFMSNITGQGGGLEFKSRKEVEQYVLKTFGEFIGKRKDKTTGVTLINKEKFNLLVDKYINDYGLADKEAELAQIEAQMKALEGDLTKAAIDDLNKSSENTNSIVDIEGIGDKDKTAKKKKYDDSYLESERRFREELYQAYLKGEENRINLMEEGYAKQLALEQLNSGRKIHELEMTNESIKILQEQLNLDLIQAQKDGDNKKVTSIKNQQQLLLEKQVEINDQICHEEELTNLRIGTIQEKAANDEIKRDNEKFDREKVLRQAKHNEALAALGTNAKAREALQREFDANELLEEEKHLKALIEKFNLIVGKGKFDNFDLSLLTPEQVQEFTDEAAKLGLTLSELIDKKNQLSGKSETDELAALGLGGQTDILGFTPDNWDTFFNNLEKGKFGINEMLFAVQGLTNMYQMYANFLAANEQAQLQRFEKSSEAKKTKLKRQLDSGYISQFTYNKQVEKIDKDLAKKKAEIDYNQAKRQRLITAANIVTATAQSIMSIWAQVPKFDFGISAGLLTGMVAALGALQLATVFATPLPAKGYEKGLYPEYVNVTREQDGKQFRPKYVGKLKSGLVSQNSLMVAEGNRPEMVIDNQAWSKISPEVQNALIREIQGIKGFEKGYYKDNVLYSGDTPTPGTDKPNSSDALVEMCLSVIAQNTEAIRELTEKTFEAVVDPDKMRNMKNLKEGIRKYEKLKEKTKK
jgi:TP901 family phage tail tape measure protein